MVLAASGSFEHGDMITFFFIVGVINWYGTDTWRNCREV